MGALRSVLAAAGSARGARLRRGAGARRCARGRSPRGEPGFALALGFWDGGEPPRQVADTYASALDGMAAAGLDGLPLDQGARAPLLPRAAGRDPRAQPPARRAGALRCPAARGGEPTFALMASAAPGHPAALGCTLPARLAPERRRCRGGAGARPVRAPGQGRGAGRRTDATSIRVAGCSPSWSSSRAAPDTLRWPRTTRPSRGWRCRGCAPPRRRVRWSSCSACRSGGRSARRATLGLRVRLYVPYGHARLPYRLSQAGARPAVLWWAARDLLQDGIRSLRPVQVFGKEAQPCLFQLSMVSIPR